MYRFNTAVDPAPNNLREYLETLCPKNDTLLETLVRETHALTQHPRMLSDAWLCTFLEWLIATHPIAHILEIGTFTGYTTIRLARALGKKGHITTLESSTLHADIAAKYFTKGGYTQQITLLRGKACELLTQFAPKSFDLVYIDADKAEYPQYLKLVEPLLPVGGIIATDNVLWGGKTSDLLTHDPRTNALREFNTLLFQNPSFQCTLVPAGDGVLLATKVCE